MIESEEEDDSAVAFKKAGSEASEPDVSKFKVFYNIKTYKYRKLMKIFFVNLFSLVAL